MSVQHAAGVTYLKWSSLIRVNSFIKDLNLFFLKKWAFVHPAKLSSGLLSSGILSSGLLS